MLNYHDEIISSSAFNIIKNDLAKNRLSHTYLIESKDENYLMKFCEEICKQIINFGTEKVSENNNLRIDQHIHPDVVFFGDESAIDADTTSKIIEQAQYSPFESKNKIFVIENADKMNEASQNKILKLIEEPPQNTYFLLLASGTAKLLQTILSRVKLIKLDLIKFDNLVKMLYGAGVDEKKAYMASSCANGNGTYAEKLALNDGFISLFNDAIEMFFSLDGSKDVLEYSSKFNDKKIDKNELFDIFEIISHDLIMILSGCENLVYSKNLIEKMKVIAQKFNISLLIKLQEDCIKCKQKLEFNVNSTAVVDELLFKLAEVKVKCRRL